MNKVEEVDSGATGNCLGSFLKVNVNFLII